MTEPIGELRSSPVESAVLRVPCPIDGCDAQIPLRATAERIEGGSYLLEFSSTAVRAHMLLTHGKDDR